MRRHNKALLVTLMLVVGVVFVTLTLQSGQSQESSTPNKPRGVLSEKQRKHQAQFPIAEYDEPEPSNSMVRQRKEAKGQRLDKKVTVRVELDADSATTDSHWANGLPVFPLSQSATVILGTVTNATAHLSTSKKTVYSEFTVEVEQVLKNTSPSQLGNMIVADRVGGRVRKPDGSIGMYWVTGQGMPEVGRRYVLFLSQENSDFSIVTGYELRDNKVLALDRPGEGHPFSTYEGADEQTFMRDLMAAISNAPTGK